MKLAWLTDLHLDVASDVAREDLFDAVAATKPDAVLVGGDVSRSETFIDHLEALADRCRVPTAFVLGNHDYYGDGVEAARERARAAAARHDHLLYLPASGVVRLTKETALIGHGCWGDGRAGRGAASTTELADFVLIRDLVGLDRPRLFEKLAALGDESAAWVREHLEAALAERPRVLLLTHVPPFVEARRCPGRASDPDSLPFYTCAAVGEVLRETMEWRPDRHLTVLSGHTHTACELEIAPNLTFRVGGARYFAPRMQRPIELAR